MNNAKSDFQAVPGGCVTFLLMFCVVVLVGAIVTGCGCLAVVAVNGVP